MWITHTATCCWPCGCSSARPSPSCPPVRWSRSRRRRLPLPAERVAHLPDHLGLFRARRHHLVTGGTARCRFDPGPVGAQQAGRPGAAGRTGPQPELVQCDRDRSTDPGWTYAGDRRLGLSRYPIRRFLPAGIVACGLWAGIYSSIGTIGGKVAHHPVWATVVAISFAVCMGMLMTQIQRLVHWLRIRRQVLAEVESERDSAGTADRVRQS